MYDLHASLPLQSDLPGENTIVETLITCLTNDNDIVQDIADGASLGVTKVNIKTPQTVMTRVELPFTISLSPGTGHRLGLRVSAMVGYSLRYYWAVPIKSFHHVLSAPWKWFYKSSVLSGDVNMFGAGEVGGSHTLSCGHEEREISISRPSDLGLGQAPREVYPLIVTMVRSGSEDAEDGAEVTALINIIHLKDDTCPIPSQILSTYIRQGSRLTLLRPLYVSESGEGECSDTESAEDSETEDWPSSARINARCIVCQTSRVNRVALPCRHANTCATCFDRLQSRCPMCRGFISSYFLLFPDPPQPQPPEQSPTSSEPEQPRSWSSLFRDWNMRLNTAMGIREN